MFTDVLVLAVHDERAFPSAPRPGDGAVLTWFPARVAKGDIGLKRVTVAHHRDAMVPGDEVEDVMPVGFGEDDVEQHGERRGVLPDLLGVEPADDPKFDRAFIKLDVPFRGIREVGEGVIGLLGGNCKDETKQTS